MRMAVLFAMVLSALPMTMLKAEGVEYESGGRRDPFLPLLGSGEEGSPKVSSQVLPGLEGIVYDEQKGSYALMGGEIYREGESIGDAVLTKISGDKVTVSRNGEVTEIVLHEDEETETRPTQNETPK